MRQEEGQNDVQMIPYEDFQRGACDRTITVSLAVI